jgi:hypothetical protein
VYGVVGFSTASMATPCHTPMRKSILFTINGRRQPQVARLVGSHPGNACKVILQVTTCIEGLPIARLQGVKGLGMVSLSDTLENPWPPLSIHPCCAAKCFSQRQNIQYQLGTSLKFR